MQFLTKKYIDEIYEPLDCIESTGSSYFLTGINPTVNTGINITYEYPSIDSSPAGITGTYIASGKGTLFVSTVSGSLTATKVMVSHRGKTSNSTSNVAANTEYNAKINWLNDGLMDINGSSTTQGTDATVDSTELRLFGRYNAGNSSYAYTPAKTKRYQISEGYVIVRDYIAVRRITDNTLGIYDKINRTFNSGVGTFTGGNAVIAAIKHLFRRNNKYSLTYFNAKNVYDDVEYLEASYKNTGDIQYCETNKYVDWTKDFTIKITTSKSDSNRSILIGSYNGVYTLNIEWQSNRTPRVYMTNVTGYHPTSQIVLDTVPADLIVTFVYTWNATTGEWTFTVKSLDGVTYNQTYSETTASPRTGTSINPMRIFVDTYRVTSPSSALNGSLKIYQLEWIENGTTVKKYIPKVLNKVRCLYDTVNNEVLTNQGGGQFEIGRRIRPVAYLTLDGTQRFNTLHYPNTLSTTYKTKIKPTETPTFAFGVRKLTGYDQSCALYIGSANFRLDWVSGSASLTTPVTVDTEYEIEITGNYAKVNDTEITASTATSYTYENPFYIGNTYTVSTASFQAGFIGNMYLGQLLNTTSRALYRDYITAIDGDGYGFLFDKLSHTIFDPEGGTITTYGERV